MYVILGYVTCYRYTGHTDSAPRVPVTFFLYTYRMSYISNWQTGLENTIRRPARDDMYDGP